MKVDSIQIWSDRWKSFVFKAQHVIMTSILTVSSLEIRNFFLEKRVVFDRLSFLILSETTVLSRKWSDYLFHDISFQTINIWMSPFMSLFDRIVLQIEWRKWFLRTIIVSGRPIHFMDLLTSTRSESIEWILREHTLCIPLRRSSLESLCWNDSLEWNLTTSSQTMRISSPKIPTNFCDFFLRNDRFVGYTLSS